MIRSAAAAFRRSTRFAPIALLLLTSQLLSACHATHSDRSEPDAAPFSTSEYAVAVHLPSCDASSPEVSIIDDDSDWKRINDAALRIFCVTPGDYSRVGTLRLRTSGTSSAPRVLRYYDPAHSTPPHPVRMKASDRAVVRGLVLERTQHWIIDGLTIQGSPPRETTLESASHNVLNRMLIQDAQYNLLRIRGSSHRNVLQNSVLRRAPIVWGGDRICLLIEDPGVGRRQEGNRIVQNELYDCTDGIQLYLPTRATRGGSFPGLVIDDNDIYLTRDRYTNCGGGLDPAGECGCAENGIDVKLGGASAAAGENVTISSNRIWGWRESDHGIGGNEARRCGASGSWGDLITLHAATSSVVIRDNLLFDGPRGIALGHGVQQVRVVRNVLYDIGRSGRNRFAIGVAGSSNEVHSNTIISSGRWLSINERGLKATDVSCNVIVDSQGQNRNALGAGSRVDYNSHFGTTPRGIAATHDVARNSASDAHNEPLCFWRRRFTGPERVCIPDAVAGARSARPASCDPPRAASN